MTDFLPEWQDDYSVIECFLCESQFNFFNRRHHCRKCGRVVCGPCSSQTVKYFPNTMVIEAGDRVYRSNPLESYRTCDVCADEIRMIRRALFLDVSDEEESTGGGNSSGGGGGGERSGSGIGGGTRTGPRNGSDTNSVTKYSTRTSTRLVDSSTNSSINTRDDLSDHNLCPVCATNMLDLYIKTHKRSISEISSEDFEAFKEDHIKSCLTTFDFEAGHSRYNDTGVTRKHPRNKMLVYNIPPIPQPKFESIGPSISENGLESTSYDTVKQIGQRQAKAVQEDEEEEEEEEEEEGEDLVPEHFRIGSVTSNSTFHQEKAHYTDENECVICLEDLKPGDKVGRLECLCVFHYKCIKDWFNKKGYGECPVHYMPQ